MRDEQRPTVVAPKGFDCQEGLVACFGPELAGPLRAALVLSARRFDGATAAGFAALAGLSIVHAVFVVFEIRDLLLDACRRRRWQARQRLL